MEKQVMDIDQVLELTDSIISRRYLATLNDAVQYSLCNLSLNDLAVSSSSHARIFHLTKFVYDSSESFLQKLVTVVNVAYSLQGTMVTVIKSDGSQIDFYIGIVAKQAGGKRKQQDRDALLEAFEGTMSGNFNGSNLGSPLGKTELVDLEQGMFRGNAICSVSMVPSERLDNSKDMEAYVQGLENLVDSLRGKSYTILTLADPVDADQLAGIQHGYEKIYNYLQPLYKVVNTQGTSNGINVSKTQTESYVRGITEGISRTQGQSVGHSTSNGVNVGASIIVLSAGYNHGSSDSSISSDNVTRNSGRNEALAEGQLQQEGASHTDTSSVQVSVENRRIKSMMDKAEQNIARLNACEGYGAFQTATYVLAEDKATALNVAGNFVSLMKGRDSGAQFSGVNCWERIPAGQDMRDLPGSNEVFDHLMKYLQHFKHPCFTREGTVEVSVATLVSGPELAIQLALPKKSVPGLTVVPMHEFGRNVEHIENGLEIGKLYFMGRQEEQTVELDVNSLAAHTFITGSTGTGKSNVVYTLMNKLSVKGVPFLVVEPAKGEYKDIFGMRSDVRVLGTNRNKTELLQMNPFAFQADIHVLEHIDRIIEVFNACWPMYAAMPAVLKEAVEEAYRACGWDLDDSINRYGLTIFPTFRDLQDALLLVIDRSAYDEEVKSNYKGSLLTRVRSLSNGLNGRIFLAAGLTDEELFDHNVIVDLSRVGSGETKAMIMGMLVIKLQEYRMSQGTANAALQHITVLEEAHNLLRRVALDQNMEGSNVQGKAVEMLTNSIAEMRTYGEGFVIADQAPGLLDRAVIRNTNTKVILRTPEYEDRLLTGRAVSLNEGQIDEIARLPLGVGVVYQNDWLEPVLCQFSQYQHDSEARYILPARTTRSEEKEQRIELVKWLLMSRIQEPLNPDLEAVERGLTQLSLPACMRLEMEQLLSAAESKRLYSWRGYPFASIAERVVEVLDCRHELIAALDQAEEPQAVEQMLSTVQQKAVPAELSDELSLEIQHCLIKAYSQLGEDELKKYYTWDHQVRYKIV